MIKRKIETFFIVVEPKLYRLKRSEDNSIGYLSLYKSKEDAENNNPKNSMIWEVSRKKTK